MRSASITCSSPARGAAPERMRLDFFASDLMVDGAPVGHLSDHAAVLAEISWRRSPTGRVAASGP